ncbi:MAG TPA: hypothetical protein VL119_06650, partial [Acidimicrobiia bacterium]|nr:hypothetical protein [Acidimicrobiia bacterium]
MAVLGGVALGVRSVVERVAGLIIVTMIGSAGLVAAPQLRSSAGATEALVVTSTADSGPGTLRAAIDRADAERLATRITFRLHHGAVIIPRADLPAIQAPVTIDGGSAVTLRGLGSGTGLVVASDNVVVRGLALSGFGIGVELRNANHAIVAGNTIVGNRHDGVRIVGRSNDDTIGGAAAGEGNTVADNGAVGVAIDGPSQRDVAALLKNHTGTIDLQSLVAAIPSRNRIVGNVIGASGGRAPHAGNRGAGVAVEGANDTTVGATDPGSGNTITMNGGAGVSITRASRTVVRGNSIFADGGGTVVRPDVSSVKSDAPTVTGLTAGRNGRIVRVSGRLHGDKNAAVTVDLFADDRCAAPAPWAQRSIGVVKVKLDGKGDAAFSTTIDATSSRWFTATATGSATSEVSGCARVPAAPASPAKRPASAVPPAAKLARPPVHPAEPVPAPAAVTRAAAPGRAATRPLAAPAAVGPCTINWDGGAGDQLWRSAANWDTNTLPSGTDVACIGAAAGTVTVDANVTVAGLQVDAALAQTAGTLTLNGTSQIATLTLVNGAIDGTGNLTVSNDFTWQSGFLTGAGTFTLASGASGAFT